MFSRESKTVFLVIGNDSETREVFQEYENIFFGRERNGIEAVLGSVIVESKL
jgi:hypothetical protein